jgi:L-fuculose-phosphate aldolase
MAWDEFKDKMNTAASILRWELANMWGHVSVRTPDGGGFILMHLRPPVDPSIPPDDVLQYDLDGKLVSGRRDEPDEVYFYSYPYKVRKDVGAVIHCHPELALAVIAAGKKIQAIHHHSIKFSGGVPVAPWLYGFWPEHGEQVMKHLGKRSALMIRAHGALIVGPTLEEACITTVQLERAARMILAAAPLGKLSPFPERAIKTLRGVPASRRARPGQAELRVPLEWRYYESLVKAGKSWSKL